MACIAGDLPFVILSSDPVKTEVGEIREIAIAPPTAFAFSKPHVKST
jgi:hypothetical protein